MRGRPGEARAHLAHALETCERIGARPAAERTRTDLAELERIDRDGV